MFGEPYTLKPLTAVWFEQRFLKLPVKENLLNCKSTFNKENVIMIIIHSSLVHVSAMMSAGSD